MKAGTPRRWAGAALGVLALAGLGTSLSGAPPKEGWERFNLDVMEMPPQVRPPGPDDTDWPYYNRTIDGRRFSDLALINEGNIDQLREECRVRVSGPGPFSAGTILVNGIIYTTAANATIAIEPTNCEVIWKALYDFDAPEIYNANRGVAHWNGRLFRGTGDGRLVSYDAMSGRELWRVKATDLTRAEYFSAAPLAWNGLVFIGIAAGDLGIAGRMMAFDAMTGEKKWSFNLIPTPGEFGNDTWLGDSWKTGGGGTWSSYTLDPETGELFVPVANPAPALDPHVRRGDNLFTNSALVLDAMTGKYRWHYQTLPADNHDYGVTPPGVLFDLGGRKLLAQASKDGYLYVVDRKSRKLAWKSPVTTIENFKADATPEGIRICPGAMGGVEYSSSAHDPARGVLVTGSVDWCYNITKTAYPAYQPGSPYIGGRWDKADAEGTGWVIAHDARTGRMAWRFRTPAPVIGGITPTAGGITFAGDTSGLLHALRTSDGKVLRSIPTGGALAGGIITYRIRGRQYVAVNSGNVSRSSWSGDPGVPSLVIYSLPDSAPAVAADPATLTPDAARGRPVYATQCASCHGAKGQGGSGPSLAGLSARYTQAQAVAFIVKPTAGMPTLYPGALTAQDVADVAAYARGFAAP